MTRLIEGLIPRCGLLVRRVFQNTALLDGTMGLRLEYRGGAQAPLEVEDVTPDRVVGMSLEEISKLPMFHGNRPSVIGDFFELSGESDGSMLWVGDLSGVHWLGAKMSSGEVVVEGPVGRHLGSEMSGGTIVVQGNASDWVGAEMGGGSIHVHGDAGHLIGSVYRGGSRGMTGGSILIDGDGGNEIGHTMRRGLIGVAGDVGDLVGFNMLAGTIVVGGESGIRHGVGMKRGTLAFLGPVPNMLPTFRRACRYQPEAMSVLLKQLERDGFPLDIAIRDAQYELFNGDLLEGGRGEILLRAG